MVQRFAAVLVAGGVAWLAAAGMAGAQNCPAPGSATTACTGDCATIAAPTVSGSRSGTVQIPISFSQGPDDAEAGRGFDDVSALAFTLGVPGTGTDAPLTVACTDGNLAEGALQVGAGIANDFSVVVENAQCAGRNHCLCPDTGAGQTRDNFVNFVVYGPRNLPEQGPVQIPILPASGVLATLTMSIAANAPDTIPLHVFSAQDAARPQFAANISMGDQAACDVTATQSRSNVAFTQGQVNVGTGPAACVGDCSGNGEVIVNELIIGVNIALSRADVSACPSFDVNHDGSVVINELISGVNNALKGCPP